MCAPATPSILLEFNSNSTLESTILVSIWELGEVFGPLIVAPLSELYGRLPVYHIANILFVLSSAAAAKSPSINVLIGCRFLLGLTVASTTLNSCIVADMFKEENRGRALAIMGMTPAIAPVLGPAVGGYISEYLGWRWTFWIITIATGAFELCFLITYCESYKVVILERKARRLRFETGNGLLRSRYDNGLSGFTLLGELVLRPFTLLFVSPVIILVSICGAFAISYTYVVITSISGIYEIEYGFSQGPLGLTYLGLGITILSYLHARTPITTLAISKDPNQLTLSGSGMILSAILCGAYLNHRQAKPSSSAPSKPEHRLQPMILGHILVPLGLIAFGWTAQYHTHWFFPILSSAPVGFGFVAVSIASWGYLVDAFGIYAASATAAVTALRNISAVALPLAGPVLFAKVGVGLGCTVLGGVALVGAVVPVVLMRCGERMRGKGKFQVKV